jgi:NAD-dependent SIR2 family protein deacetylase
VRALQDFNKLRRCYTQNIDALDTAAGITKIVNCHGSFATATCIDCGARFAGSEIEAAAKRCEVPVCVACGVGVVKPDVTFFGEKLSDEFFDRWEEDRRVADLFIVIGSSLLVSPVNQMLSTRGGGGILTPQPLCRRTSQPS